MNAQLTAEQEARLKKLQRDGQTFSEVCEQVIDLGLYQLEYRRERNPKKAEEQKLARQLLRKARTDPELAVKLGLGTRIAL